MTITLYGIKNCDSVKKAKKWFEAEQIDYTFHDFRSDGIDSGWLAAAEKKVGWEVLLNKRGTTFRQLDDETKQSLNQTSALNLMLEQPTLIKRPVVQNDEDFTVGFNPTLFADTYSA